MNKTIKLVDIINEIIDLAQIGISSPHTARSIRSFGFGENSINFIGENYSKYINVISRAFDFDNDIKNTYTLKEYENLLINYFRKFFLTKALVKETDVKLFKQELKAEPLKAVSVFREIFGIILKLSQNPLSLGKFRIYDFSVHKNLIASKANINSQKIHLGNKPPKYLIECEVKARTFDKALEIANEYFEQFELIISFMIGSSMTDFKVTILKHQGWSQHTAFMIADDKSWSQSSALIGFTQPLTLDDPYFSSEELGYKIIWELTNGNNLNKFQSRLILAIEWIGQSITEKLPQIAFLNATIALEIIFTYSKNDIITPSILNQISVSTALILGTSIDERMEIESKVKKLYGLRSKIVHSGNKDINKEDHEYILAIAQGIVIKLLTADQLKTISSVDELHKALKKIKYSGTAL